MNRSSQNSRRRFLTQCGTLASVALLQQLSAAGVTDQLSGVIPGGGHHPARAKRLIKVFLTGGFSHVDTFDPKPSLNRDQGKIVDAPHLRGVAKSPLLGSPFTFTPRGDSGIMISELFPKLGDVADDLCVIRSLHTDIVEHFQAALAMHTGSPTIPLPSLGSC